MPGKWNHILEKARNLHIQKHLKTTDQLILPISFDE
jgi:hypothetical protein